MDTLRALPTDCLISEQILALINEGKVTPEESRAVAAPAAAFKQTRQSPPNPGSSYQTVTPSLSSCLRPQSSTKRRGRSSPRNTSVGSRTSRRPAVPSGPSPAAGSSSTSSEASLKKNKTRVSASPPTCQNSLQQRRKKLCEMFAFVCQASRGSPPPWRGVPSPGEEATSWTAWTSGTTLGAGAWTWTWSSFTSTPSTGWSASSSSASSVTSSFLLFDSPAAEDMERRDKKKKS